jgi:hypothetical protein
MEWTLKAAAVSAGFDETTVNSRSSPAKLCQDGAQDGFIACIPEAIIPGDQNAFLFFFIHVVTGPS